MSKRAIKSYPDWALLETWVVLLENHSVSKASLQLGITQAAVSQRIKVMEDLLGTDLLDRAMRPARPTAAGQRLFDHAVELLKGAEEMVESVRQISKAKRLTVRMGCVDSFAATIGPLIIRGLVNSSHQVRLWSGITPELDEQLKSRNLDLVVTTSEQDSLKGIVKRKIFSESYCIALPKGVALKTRNFVELIQRYPLIRYSMRSLIGQQVEQFVSVHAKGIEKFCEFDATDPVLSLVSAGAGFAITTPLCVWQSRHYAQEIELVPLSHFQSNGTSLADLKRTFFLCYREGDLGSLPLNIYNLIYEVSKHRLSKEISLLLKLDHQDIMSF